MSWSIIAAFVSGLVIGPVLLVVVLAFLAAGIRQDEDEDSSDHSLGIGANG